MDSVYSPLLTIENIRQALTGPLPGETGQKKMAPEMVKGRINRWQQPDSCREAGVLLLLYPHRTNTNESEIYIILTRRHEYPGVLCGGDRHR